MSRGIQGILFDLGDTLLNFGELDINSLFEQGGLLAYEYLQKLGQPLPPFEVYHRRQYWAVRWNYFLSHFRRREFNSLNLMKRLTRRMGLNLTHEQAVEVAWLWYEPLSKQATQERGTREMLQRLANDGRSLGIVSNTFVPGEVLDRHLQRANLLDLFPSRIYSCDVGYRKPDRRIFRKALRENNVNARRTIFVGDSLRADIDGANRVSMITVWKRPASQSTRASTRANHQIHSLLELEDIVARYESSRARRA
jgi:HAD superfamily hydrolase (TIGR01509 family)